MSKYNISMNITRKTNKHWENKKKQLVVSYKQIHSAPLNTINVNAVADITKLLQLLPDQNTWKKSLKNIVSSGTNKETGIDEDNFNRAGNLLAGRSVNSTQWSQI